MTNSIATSKCPSTVLSAGNYGISQNRCSTDETKEYIFVKLTDSALRAIEEYQRNDNAKRFKGTEQSAKIQFSGNNGFIHFPLPDSQEGRKFGFAIDDVEGSLECIHQNQQELNVLGALSYRMRIHANDDVYDTTRTKMAIAEETEKSKCIREIKPNQTDIGRKVKKSVSAAAVAATINQNKLNINNNAAFHLNTINAFKNNNISSKNNNNNNNNSNSYISSRNKLPILSSAAGSGISLNANSSAAAAAVTHIAASRSPNTVLHHNNSSNSTFVNNNNNNYSSAVSTLSSQLASGISNGYAEMKATATAAAAASSTKSNLSKSGIKSINNGGQKGNAGAGGGGGNKQLPDISRRKIRERLIHLLALKPFKKPELYTRLQNEGLRDRERSLISNILKDISSLSRDNTFNLKRQMWNDVNENWPYYTEQEIQQLKRRKPQNLTPPLSSDAGSSTSGHSPTSIHTGSPPPVVGGANSMSAKRSAADAADVDNFFSGVQSKKQRISHFKKDPGPGITAAANQRFTTNTNGIRQTAATDYLNVNRHNNINNNNNSNNNKNHNIKSPNTFIASSGIQQQQQQQTTNDLSFNVLDNVDELMPHMMQEQINNNNFLQQQQRKTATTKLKDKPQQQQQQQNNNNNNTKRHNYANNTAAISPKPYGSSFVPESGRKTNNNLSPQPKKQQQIKTTMKHLTAKQQPQQQYASSIDKHNDDNNVLRSQSPNITIINNYKIPKNRYQQQSAQPNVKNVRQQQSQQQQHTQPQQSTATVAVATTAPPPPQQQQQNNNNNNINNNYSSPTQQIAAAASNYATTALNDTTTPRQKYDFSQYTAITSIEQRRKYKTEFEADYDEYLKLLAQIESVGKRFRALADQLENARKGCADYFEIKQKIVIEYERIRNEESLRRDKQRFDYLHEKLAHIKQLVTDYDKTLTDAAAAAAAQAEQLRLQQQQQEQQLEEQLRQQQLQIQQQQLQIQQLQIQQQQQRLSPMIISEGESNTSPPMNYHSSMLMQQQQQQQQKYHAAETIPYQQQQQQQLLETNKSLSSQLFENSTATHNFNQQQQHHAQQLEKQPQQKKEVHIIINNSDSDSSSTSDECDDDDDDDNSNSNDSD